MNRLHHELLTSRLDGNGTPREDGRCDGVKAGLPVTDSVLVHMACVCSTGRDEGSCPTLVGMSLCQLQAHC